MRNGNLRAVDPPGPGGAAFVGAEELDQLKDSWSQYRATTDPRNGPLDPVEALHCTGAVLRAVNAVITTCDRDGDR